MKNNSLTSTNKITQLVLMFGLLILAGCQSDSNDNSGNNNDPNAQQTASCPELGVLKTQLLAAINAARAQARTCGGTSYPAVSAVTWNDTLQAVAQDHSDDMATNNFLSNTSSSGLPYGDRLESAGYLWGVVAGVVRGTPTSSTDDMVEQALVSAEECVSIMYADVMEIGGACSTHADTDYSYYWTIIQAAPRS